MMTPVATFACLASVTAPAAIVCAPSPRLVTSPLWFGWTYAVAPVAMPSSLVLSVPVIKPAAPAATTLACNAPPARAPCAVSSKRAAGSIPDARSAALPDVAIAASPVIVPTACVPVWFARASKNASALLAVAPFATFNTARDCVAVIASGTPVPAVVRPMNVAVATFAISVSVTTPALIVQTVPELATVISPLTPSDMPPPPVALNTVPAMLRFAPRVIS